MNANILRLLGLVGGVAALKSKSGSDKDKMKKAELQALSDYENSQAAADREAADPEYDSTRFLQLRKKIRGQY